jgi:hypothetical protein
VIADTITPLQKWPKVTNPRGERGDLNLQEAEATNIGVCNMIEKSVLAMGRVFM